MDSLFEVRQLMNCGQQDSNLHGLPLEPKSSASTNSAMTACEYERCSKNKNRRIVTGSGGLKNLMRHAGIEPATT